MSVLQFYEIIPNSKAICQQLFLERPTAPSAMPDDCPAVWCSVVINALYRWRSMWLFDGRVEWRGGHDRSDRRSNVRIRTTVGSGAYRADKPTVTDWHQQTLSARQMSNVTFLPAEKCMLRLSSRPTDNATTSWWNKSSFSQQPLCHYAMSPAIDAITIDHNYHFNECIDFRITTFHFSHYSTPTVSIKKIHVHEGVQTKPHTTKKLFVRLNPFKVNYLRFSVNFVIEKDKSTVHTVFYVHYVRRTKSHDR